MRAGEIEIKGMDEVWVLVDYLQDIIRREGFCAQPALQFGEQLRVNTVAGVQD
jgi:hypothetical protein